MNKILVDGDKLILDSNIKNIEVKGFSKIYIKNLNEDITLNIHLFDNANLEILDFNVNKINKCIKIDQDNNTCVNYIHTFNIVDNYKLIYRANLLGNNNINNIYISGVSKGNVLFDLDAYVNKNTKDNIINENVKILTVDGKASVLPMLHVSTKEVIANHNTAISNIREDELFYLMSKGIKKDKAINLISDGYTYGFLKKYDEEFFNLINE